ncbi:MAG: nuclear transport factor 2 family protein [Gemmatimonadaceae bacterium]
MQDSPAVTTALAHIEAWSRQDWDTTRALLAPEVHALVTTTQAKFGGSEFTGVDEYMARKIKAARLIEPGSVQVISALGDDSSSLVTLTMRIGLGPDGSMVPMARACVYMLDENGKIAQERDVFVVLSS